MVEDERVEVKFAYCIWCLDAGDFVVGVNEIPITKFSTWPACMAHLILYSIGKVVCV